MNTKTRAKKFISPLLVMVVVCGLFAAMPLAANAASDENELAAIINSFDPGNDGPVTGQLTAIANTTNHTVTVIRGTTGAKNCLELNIASGVTVIWKAEYYGWTNGNGLISLTGEGTLEVAEGGALINNGPDTTVTGHNAFSVIKVSGGTVEATGSGHAISTAGKVDVSSGMVKSTTGNAIRAIGMDSAVTISGGTVSCASGNEPTIYARRINVNSIGRVDATGTNDAIKAVGKHSTVTVSGGTVSAATGYAIMTDDDSSVTVSGGFVFAYGMQITDFAGLKGAILMFSGTPAISGSGVVCAWNPPALVPSYTEGTVTDLTVHPAGMARWGKNGSQSGISYADGAFPAFFPINGMTVTSTSGGSSTTPGDSSATSPTFTAYLVKVTVDSLNIRKGPGTDTAVVGAIKDKGVYTIVDEANGSGAARWGKLKSGAGWISLDFSDTSALGDSTTKPGDSGSTTPAFTAYLVKVTVDSLNIRKGPGSDTDVVGAIKDRGVYTIVDEANGPGATKWGKLKSGAGWISLDYTKKQ